MATNLMVLFSSRSLKKISLEVNWQSFRCLTNPRGGGAGGGGGNQVKRGAAPALRISEGSGLFKTSACPQICKRRVLFCTQVQSKGGGGG